MVHTAWDESRIHSEKYVRAAGEGIRNLGKEIQLLERVHDDKPHTRGDTGLEKRPGFAGAVGNDLVGGEANLLSQLKFIACHYFHAESCRVNQLDNARDRVALHGIVHGDVSRVGLSGLLQKLNRPCLQPPLVDHVQRRAVFVGESHEAMVPERELAVVTRVKTPICRTKCSRHDAPRW
jgi:hypothetical protein